MSFFVNFIRPQQTKFTSVEIPAEVKDLSAIVQTTLSNNSDPRHVIRYIDLETKAKYYRAAPDTVCQVFPKDRETSRLEGMHKTLRKAVLFTYNPSTGTLERNENVLAIKQKTRLRKGAVYTELPPARMNKQIDIFKTLGGSQGIAQMLGTFTYQSTVRRQIKPVLIMPLYENGDLQGHIELGAWQHHPQRNVRIHNILLDLFHGLHTLHTHGFVHRDIKLENILLDANWRAAITDFDAAAHCDDPNRFENCLGTIEYMAPEYLTILGCLYNQDARVNAATTAALDMWSAGAVLYILFALDPANNLPTDLYLDPLNNAKSRKPMYLKHPFFKERPANLSPYGSLVWDLLQIDPAKRPTAAAVLRRLEEVDPSLNGLTPSPLGDAEEHNN